MKYCTNCVSPSSAPLPGKTSSNGCYYALRQNKNIISASNSSPSHSLTLESFAQVKTCNQFIEYSGHRSGRGGYLRGRHRDLRQPQLSGGDSGYALGVGQGGREATRESQACK